VYVFTPFTSLKQWESVDKETTANGFEYPNGGNAGRVQHRQILPL
jgi:hypothetical protein